MKYIHFLSLVSIVGASLTPGFAQTRSLDGNGFNPSDIHADPQEGVKETTRKVVKIEYIAVSPEREWKSADESQSPITGALLAFYREKETGKVCIVKDENVRLLVGKQDFTLPLAKLSEEDQTYIGKLVANARAAGKLIESSSSENEAESEE